MRLARVPVPFKHLACSGEEGKVQDAGAVQTRSVENMALNKEVQYSARFSGGNCRRAGQCRLFSGRKNGFTCWV